MKDFTEIVIILDESGSMFDTANKTLEGLNSFIREQRELGPNASLTLVLFNGQVRTEFESTPITMVPVLTSKHYHPNGTTALLDAIGTTIAKAKYNRDWTRYGDVADKGMLVIVTDGEENSSREYTKSTVFTMIANVKEAMKWEVIYLGANQDAIDVAHSYGITQDHSINYSATDVGTKSMYTTMSNVTSDYRTTGSLGDDLTLNEVPETTET